MLKPCQRAALFLAMCSAVCFSLGRSAPPPLPPQSQVQSTQVQTANAHAVAARAWRKLLPGKAKPDPPQKTRQHVILGGEVFGIKLYTKGVLVAKTDLVSTANGNQNPAQAAGLRSGDLILQINGNDVARKSDVATAVAGSQGKPLALRVERNGQALQLQITPVATTAGSGYAAGLWIRDSSAGIGTVSFYDPQSGSMAGLGHAICDVDTGERIQPSGGELVAARVMGCYRSANGAPGELCGVFEPQTLAALNSNEDTGVFGKLVAPPTGELLPVATRDEVHPGPAQVWLTLNGTTKKAYAIEITRVNQSPTARQKQMSVRITDPELIATAGGIVQGMSGSPIVQNGQLVGAVTHVFVNSPLEGYAVFAETMLQSARDSVGAPAL